MGPKTPETTACIPITLLWYQILLHELYRAKTAEWKPSTQPHKTADSRHDSGHTSTWKQCFKRLKHCYPLSRCVCCTCQHVSCPNSAGSQVYRSSKCTKCCLSMLVSMLPCLSSPSSPSAAACCALLCCTCCAAGAQPHKSMVVSACCAWFPPMPCFALLCFPCCRAVNV